MQQTVVIPVEPRGGYTAQIIAISKTLLCCQNVSGSVVCQKLQKSVITVNTCSRASREKIFTPLVVSDAVSQKHCLLPILSCDAHRLLNAAIPSKAIANAGLSRHRHSPAGGLLKCLVLPAGFGAKHILDYVQERKIMNLKPSGSRDDDNNNNSGGRIDPNINETDTIVLINITAMTMII